MGIQNKRLDGQAVFKSSVSVSQDILRTTEVERRIKMTLIINPSVKHCVCTVRIKYVLSVVNKTKECGQGSCPQNNEDLVGDLTLACVGT